MGARHFRWSEIHKEHLSDEIDRRLVTGDQQMLAHVYLKIVAFVPLHHHDNEQRTYILEGSLHFYLGEDEKEEVVVSAGEVLHIPSNLPHNCLLYTSDAADE